MQKQERFYVILLLNLEIWPVLKAYTKPQSNQILARYQLRRLKQGDISLEEFVIKARLLIDDGGYISAVRDSTLRNTLVFGLKSVRKDSIALGNTLIFRQVYDVSCKNRREYKGSNGNYIERRKPV